MAQKNIPNEIMEKILQYKTQLLFSEWFDNEESYYEPGTKQRIQAWMEYFFHDKNSLYNKLLSSAVIIKNIDALQVELTPEKIQLKLNISYSNVTNTIITKKNMILNETYCWNVYTMNQYHIKEMNDEIHSQEILLAGKNGFFITQPLHNH